MEAYIIYRAQNCHDYKKKLNKAVLSKCSEIVFRECSYVPEKCEAKSISLILEVDGNESFKKENWNEIHLIVKDPKIKLDVSHLDAVSKIVLSPTSVGFESAWIQVIKSLKAQNLLEKTFIEFCPWSAEEPFLMTCNEVGKFLYQLKYHFPEWEPRRRPHISLWDQRIPDSFELEASTEDYFEYALVKNPMVTVVIPSFNAKLFLSNVVRHLFDQQAGQDEYEILVVDDGSSDGTKDYLESLGYFKNKNLNYIYWPRASERKRGQNFFRAGLSRNLGVRYAKADKIVFLDSDIIVGRDFISKVLSGLEEYDIIQFPRRHINQDKSTSYTRINSIDLNETYIEEENYWKRLFESLNWSELPDFWKYTCTYALGIRKEDFYRAGRFQRFYISYGFEDTELGYRMFKLGKKFGLIKSDVFHLTSYSQSEYSFSRKKRHQLLQKTAKLFFLNNLDLKIFECLNDFMYNEAGFRERFKLRFKNFLKSVDFKF